jgi:beta-phosphoglucomutase-like phosphatase (HAD superfamily)
MPQIQCKAILFDLDGVLIDSTRAVARVWHSASALGFSAADCVVVEDVPAGIRAGKASGARVIAFRTTVKDPELVAAGADWLLNNCNDISVAKKGPELTLALASDPPRTT